MNTLKLINNRIHVIQKNHINIIKHYARTDCRRIIQEVKRIDKKSRDIIEDLMKEEDTEDTLIQKE